MLCYACSQHYKTLPQALHIYMCWPVAWTDAVFNNHSGDSLEDPLSFGDRTPESRHDHMTGSERKVTTEDMRAYLQQVCPQTMSCPNVKSHACSIGVDMCAEVACRGRVLHGHNDWERNDCEKE